MVKNFAINWLPGPEEKDYPAAESYLSLMYEESTVNTIVNKLRSAPLTQFKAKDISRASGLSLLGVSNSHVKKYREKIEDEKLLSPVLLVRDKRNSKVIIVDG